MVELDVNKECCKACGYCIHFCKRDVLRLGEDTNAAGCRYVVVSQPERCIACGICTKVCGESVFTLKK